MALQPFQDEQLNYFKFASIVLNEFPKALRQTFRSMWDNTFGHLPGFQTWDDSIVVRNMFLNKEGGRTKVPTNISYKEWDCTALFQATIYARSFALPDSAGHHKTLSDLYVKPHKLAHGSFHATVVSPGGNEAETFAIAIDQLRLLRNSLCHSTSSEIIKVTFDQYVQHARDAFKALGIKTDPIDAIGGLAVSDFPTKEVRKLEQGMKEETQAYVKFLEGLRTDVDELKQILTGMKAVNASKEDIATLEQKINDLTEASTQDKPDSKVPMRKPRLPTMVPHFTGRKRECEEVTGQLTSGSARIVSIWGSPGFGKTSVAIAVGHHLESQGLPVYFLSIRGLQSIDDLTSKLLRLFGRPVAIDPQLSIDDELFHLFSEMSDPFTIILDNADELLSGGSNVKEDLIQFLADILRETEKVTFVITSRESLEFISAQFQGHKAVRISPLDAAASQNLLNELLPNATASAWKRIANICAHVPLAIKLCASIFKDDAKMSQILDDLEGRRNIVERLDIPDYPSNLRLNFLFESSFQKLSAQEKEALVSLSVIPKSFDLTLAAAVVGKSETPEVKKILYNLQRKSLLDSSSKPGSFVMHQLLQSFASQRKEDEMKEMILTAKARLCAFYVFQFNKLNEKFLTGDSMSAFIEFYEDEQSITQSLIEGCSDSKTAKSVFEVLVKAELFLYSVYWREESKFYRIYDSALKMSRKENVSNSVHRQLLVSKSLYQVTWGQRGNTMLLLSEVMDIEASCASVCVDDKGKRLCYCGIYQLVDSQTEAGVQSLKEALSLMSDTPEKRILRIIAFQILATYHRYKNNTCEMPEFVSKSFQECQSPGTEHLLFIPEMESTGKRIEEKRMTQQPLKLEIISLVIDAAKHFIDTETKRCMIDAAKEITNGIGKSPVQSSLGSFIFQCNANITLQHLIRKDEGADEMPEERIIGCHEMALNLPKRPVTAPDQQTHTTNKLLRPRSKQSCQAPSRLRRPVTADTEKRSRLADRYHTFGNTQHKKSNLISPTQGRQQAHDLKLKGTGEKQSSIADSFHLVGVTQHEEGDFSSALQSKQRALDIRATLFGEEHAITADSYYSLGVTQYEQGDFSSALQSTQRALHIRLKLLGEEHSSTADSYQFLGIMQHDLGDLSSALQSAQRALNIRRKLFGEEHPSTAESYYLLSDTQHEKGDFYAALKSAQRALDIRLKLFGEEHASTAYSYHSLGDTQHAQSDFFSALQSTQRALDIRLKLFGDEHSSTADSYHSLGITQHRRGDFSSALMSARRALDIRLKLFGEHHSSTANSYHFLGITQHAQGDVSSAVQSAKRALDIRLKLFGEEHSSTADTYCLLSDTQHDEGDFTSALQSAQRALDIRRKLFGEEHSSTADSYHSLWITQHEQGEFSKAIQSTQRALDIRRKLFGEEHSSTADSYYSLGITQHQQRDFSSAVQSIKRALDIRLKLFGEKHSSTADSCHLLGDTQLAQGNLTSALQSTQRALKIRRKLFGEEHSSTASSYHLLGITQHEQGNLTSALQSTQRALDIRLKLFGEDHSSTASSYHLLGITQHRQGNLTSALQSTQRALKIRLKLFGEQHSSTADSYSLLSNTQHEQGDFSSALYSAQRALDIRLKLFGDEHSSTADSYHSVGITHQEQGDFPSALYSAERALDIRRKLFGDEHSSTAESYQSLGDTQHEQGDFTSALQSIQRALEIRLKLFGEQHSSTADSYHLIGIIQHEQGDLSSARQSTINALNIRLKLFGEEHSSTADSYRSLGITQHEQGDFTSALQSKQRALDIRRKLFGEEHSSTADSYCSLSDTQHEDGDFSSALYSAQRALDIRRKLFGEEHSSTADSYDSLGSTQFELGDRNAASWSRQRALDIRSRLLQEESLKHS